MQRMKKTTRIIVPPYKMRMGEKVRPTGVRAYGTTQHATTGVSPKILMFGRELRGKFPEMKTTQTPRQLNGLYS